jgi:hypothetical protein
MRAPGMADMAIENDELTRIVTAASAGVQEDVV